MFNSRASRDSSGEAGRDNPFKVYGRSGVKAQRSTEGEDGGAGDSSADASLAGGTAAGAQHASPRRSDGSLGPAGPDRPRRHRPGLQRRVRGRPRGTRGRCFARAGLRAFLAATAPELPCLPGASGWVAGGRWARGGSCGLDFCFVVRRDVPTPVPGPRGVSGGAWVALWAAASPGASENTVKIVRGSRSCHHPSPRSPAKRTLRWSSCSGQQTAAGHGCAWATVQAAREAQGEGALGARSGGAAASWAQLRARPGGPEDSMGPEGPGQQLFRLPSPGAGPLTGWPSAPGKELPGGEGCLWPGAAAQHLQAGSPPPPTSPVRETDKALPHQIRVAPMISQILSGGWRQWGQ